MRNEILLGGQWQFAHPDGTVSTVTLPHTWNASDGQDGGNDYRRGTGTYQKHFPCPTFDPETQCVYLEFRGVNASAKVYLNGKEVLAHDGGYSTFRADVTTVLEKENLLRVEADNSVNDTVYPQKADFTFYGGIYRDVFLVVVNRNHFDMDYYGGSGLAVSPTVSGADGKIHVRTWHNAAGGQVHIRLLDHAGGDVASGDGTDITLTVENVHLWDGLRDPYL